MTTNKPARVLVGDFVYVEKRGKKGLYSATWWRHGKHHRKALGTRNCEEAIRQARRLAADLLDGSLESRTASLPIAQAIQKFLDHKLAESRRRKTLVRYQGILSVFCEAMTGRRRSTVPEITTEDIVAFRRNRRTRHGTIPEPKTMHNELVCIKGLLSWCCEQGFIEKNPASSIRPKKPIPPRRGGPTEEQIAAILDVARPYRRPHLALLAMTGMRSGELVNLLGEDIDLEGNWIHVVSRPDAPTKNGQSRKVPIHPYLRAFLLRLPRTKGKPLFTSPPSPKYPAGGRRLNAKHLNEEFARILRKVGLPAGRKEGFTVHSLRHSFETIAVNANVPQRVIDSWLGHTGDRSMGFNYYRLSDKDSQSFITRVPFSAPTCLRDDGIQGLAG